MFHSQLSLFIAPSAGRTAVTLSPGSAAALVPLGHSTPHFSFSFASSDHLPLPAPFFPLPTHIPLLIPWHPALLGAAAPTTRTGVEAVGMG